MSGSWTRQSGPIPRPVAALIVVSALAVSCSTSAEQDDVGLDPPIDVMASLSVSPAPTQTSEPPPPVTEDGTVMSQRSTTTSSAVPVTAPRPVPPVGDFFVSPTGDGTDGRSWTTAWNELDRIDWGIVRPGDVVVLDGGADGVTYRTQLQPGSSGATGEPVIITTTSESGRGGTVTIDGGRPTPLPYCGQLTYDFQDDGVRTVGVVFDEVHWIVLDGLTWNGLVIRGHNGPGITISPGSSHVTIRNVEVTDNGVASQNDKGEWRPSRAGVRLGGANVRLERLNIHDNGHDAIQSFSGDNRIADFVLSGSWLHNERRHPANDESYNYCRHPDGVQIYSGGRVTGVIIENSFIGPGLTQGVILGQTDDGLGSGVVVDDVVLRNTVFAKNSGISIYGYRDVKSARWTIDHVTADCPTEITGVCLWIEGDGHRITNSVFVGSRILTPDGIAELGDNCQWETSADADLVGRIADPKFAEVSVDPFRLGDYSIGPDSECAGLGASATTVDELIGR